MCTITVEVDHVPVAKHMTRIDRFTLVGTRNLISDIDPVGPDGLVRVVVEIPAGTCDKYEVSKPEGHLCWELQDGVPRVVQYLPYPGNYGMIPGTLLDKDDGGDGDPLDVLVVGPMVPRGSVIEVRPIAVLRLLDGGEVDDKIIAVDPAAPLGAVAGLSELQSRYAGVTEIIETWFTNYKGPGAIKSLGWQDSTNATEMFEFARKNYLKSIQDK